MYAAKRSSLTLIVLATWEYFGLAITPGDYHGTAPSPSVPVAFVVHGTEIPVYIWINIELASRNNDVILISEKIPTDNSYLRNCPTTIDSVAPNRVAGVQIQSNRSQTSTPASCRVPSGHIISFASSDSYSGGAQSFAPKYNHLSRDHSKRRMNYELKCIQRWFVLRDYMRATGLTKVFFGDGDSVVFGDVTKAAAMAGRARCDAVINAEIQWHDFHWVAAGEASIWTLPAIDDFCAFTDNMYGKHFDLLRMKGNGGSTVTDMSMLWLWWVWNHKDDPVGWATGRPYAVFTDENGVIVRQQGFELDKYRNTSDHAFEFTKRELLKVLGASGISASAPVQSVAAGAVSNAGTGNDTRNGASVMNESKKLTVCNGLDVVDRTVFDHMHGWLSGSDFTLDYNNTGLPYLHAATSVGGGKAESLDPSEVTRLEKEKLYILNLHYQGQEKMYLPYDVCRILLFTGSKVIVNDVVRTKCQEEIAKHPGLACQAHLPNKGLYCF